MRVNCMRRRPLPVFPVRAGRVKVYPQNGAAYAASRPRSLWRRIINNFFHLNLYGIAN